ncbi:class I SAM-dependent methyltransferase [Candidatus Poriferisodalis sp.]|uniref:class I SAM-dependent methyltransferase n=1 Tax=Candidatus Poriferisodalis sp. TaxID=3101277 RepID=UPI003B52ED07
MYAVSEHRTGSDLDALIEFAEPVSDDVVLDVATGAGHVALALAPLVSSVVAADLATGMVDKARERGGAQGEDAREVCEMFRGAPDAAKEYFEIEIVDDVTESFSDDKIVIRATSPRL